MKYVIALVACGAAIFFWALLSVAVGWDHGGGIIGMLFMWAVIAGIWSTIMSKFPDDNSSRGPISSKIHKTSTPPHVNPTPSTPQDKYEALATLKKLKDSDVLTEDEYAKEKQKILNT